MSFLKGNEAFLNGYLKFVVVAIYWKCVSDLNTRNFKDSICHKITVGSF